MGRFAVGRCAVGRSPAVGRVPAVGRSPAAGRWLKLLAEGDGAVRLIEGVRLDICGALKD